MGRSRNPKMGGFNVVLGFTAGGSFLYSPDCPSIIFIILDKPCMKQYDLISMVLNRSVAQTVVFWVINELFYTIMHRSCPVHCILRSFWSVLYCSPICISVEHVLQHKLSLGS